MQQSKLPLGSPLKKDVIEEEEKEQHKEVVFDKKKKGYNKKMTNVKKVILGDKVLFIDNDLVIKENNKAAVQCADNHLAFYSFKLNKLFNGDKFRPKHLVERLNKQNVVKSYKLMSKSAAIPPGKRKVPVLYPKMNEHKEEKKKLRDLHRKLHLDQYLSDHDSSMMTFSSVDSEASVPYEEKYKHLNRT